jgi:hypothetical protein
MSLRRRLERLEGGAGEAGSFARSLSRAALAALSDEDLDALEDMLQAGEGEDLDARGRRALDAYTDALEDARRGERRGA